MAKKIKEDNYEIEKNNQNNLRELEQFVVNGKLDNLLARIEEKKEETLEMVNEYVSNNSIEVKNKDGEVIATKIVIKPLVINNYFFKSVVPLRNQMPQYNAEKLGLVYDLYIDIISRINETLGEYPPTLTSFCKMAGITMNELRSYRNSIDLSMRIVVDKIYDEIGDNNLTMSQLGKLNERSTIFRLKSQNEMIEKEQPKVSINIVEQPDINLIQERLKKYKGLN